MRGREGSASGLCWYLPGGSLWRFRSAGSTIDSLIRRADRRFGIAVLRCLCFAAIHTAFSVNELFLRNGGSGECFAIDAARRISGSIGLDAATDTCGNWRSLAAPRLAAVRTGFVSQTKP
ncbi:MAG: hypothetical protein AABZ47_16165 [Planctomycetota bacterium]